MIEIPGFKLKEEIYRGTHTSVYRAIRLKDYHPVMLKMLYAERPDLSELARLRREFEILMKIGGNGIVRAYSLNTFQKTLIMVTEDIEGINLRQYMNGEPMDIPKFLKLSVRICRILERIHNQFIIHKDLNPANIIYSPTSDELQIIDFGIASMLTRENQNTYNINSLEGTLPFVSPEQTGRMNRSIDSRSDFYSLGISFYYFLSGTLPFTSQDPLELVHAHLARQAKSLHDMNPDIPLSISKIVDKMIAKAPEDRYQTARGLIQDLQDCERQLKQKGYIPNFTPGLRDRSSLFYISEKLYGREEDTNKLIRVFEQAGQGQALMVSISGSAGQGKSSLVQEIQRSILAKRGYFVSGKFDQLKQNIPYASLMEAFSDLIHQILTESNTKLRKWQNIFIKQLGKNAQLIIKLIPELELIIGPQPEVPELPTNESQNRFQLVLNHFAKAFASREHPLVLFLDDLHWADSASLNMIRLLLGDYDSKYILIIGSYRTEELQSNLALNLLLDDLKLKKPGPQTIELTSLSYEKIRMLLADTFHTEEDHCEDLAKLCFEKTKGNPLFLNQFLVGLHQDGHFTYEPTQGHWVWDIKTLKGIAVSNNLSDFMIHQIERLNPATQKVLKLASCIGNRFDLHTLSMVNEKSPRLTATDLWQSLSEGLIMPTDDAYKFAESSGNRKITYRFLHDRVQQAAYTMLSERERKEIHLKIGRLLFGDQQAHGFEEASFHIVNQLNFGKELITSPMELRNLAQLNYLAGNKARSSSAYDAALKYYETGIDLLENNAWRNQHDLTFGLYLGHAECLHLCGCPERAEAQFDEIYKYVNTTLERARVLSIKILVETHLSRPIEAIEIGLQGLALFNITFPDSPQAQQEMQDQEIEKIKLFLQDRDIDSLIDQPQMTDVGQLMVMYLLMNMTPPTYYTNQSLYRLVILKMVRISIEYGNAASSSFAYVNFGTLLITRFNDFRMAYRFGILALKLGNRFENTGLTYKVKFVFATFINHWTNHLKSSMDYFQKAHHYAFESGDLLFASYVGHHMLDTMFLKGDPIEDMLNFSEKYLDFSNKGKQLDATLVTQIYRQYTLCLLGKTIASDSFSDDSFNEDDFLKQLKKRPVRYPLVFYNIHKCGLLLLNNKPQKALIFAEEADAEIHTIHGMAFYAEHFFYYSLAILGIYDDLNPKQKTTYLCLIKRNQSKLERWCQSCPANFQAKYRLIEAEIARIEDKKWDAMELYEQAINAARSHEFIHIEAICHELAARFWKENGKPDFAQLHISNAHYDYKSWGATAKAKAISDTHLIKGRSPLKVLNRPSTNRSEFLDLSAVIKASQAMSINIILGDLLEDLLSILIESAGAQFGCLILEHDHEDDYRVEAASNISTGDMNVFQSINYEDYPHLATSVVNYALRTREIVVLNNAAKEGLFTGDPYIVKHEPKSILCLPIINQFRLGGVLYLENNLTPSAFTTQRLEVLRILTTQAAISIEKAKLYSKLEEYSRTLEQKVEERTSELQEKNREIGSKHEALIRTQKQLVLQEKMASLGELTAGIAHEIRNPLNFINNFAKVTADQMEELMEIFQEHKQCLPKETQIDMEEILENFQTNTGIIAEHGEVAGKVVQNMEELSRGQVGIRRPADLNRIVSEFARLATQGMQTRTGSVQIQINEELAANIGEINIVSQDIGRAILNIVNNACYAMIEKHQSSVDNYLPCLSIKTCRTTDVATIIIRDNGTGIPQILLDKVFNPFFTTKPANRENIGLGLSISYDIVKGHQGEILIDTVENEFTEVKIMLPIIDT